jgi:hypothetical protein
MNTAQVYVAREETSVMKIIPLLGILGFSIVELVVIPLKIVLCVGLQ